MIWPQPPTLHPPTQIFNLHLHSHGDFIMGNKEGDNISIGNVGAGANVAAGRYATAINQAAVFGGTAEDLANELTQLLPVLKQHADADEHYDALVAASKARTDAQQGDKDGALKRLQDAGLAAATWIWGHADAIGAVLLTEYLRMTFSLG